MKKIEKIDFYTPEFLLCEIPIKNNSYHDNRVWIYCVNACSLIEFVFVDERWLDFGFTVENNRIERFEYKNAKGIIEDYFGVFTQDNCEFFGKNSKQIMQAAWNFYKNYLRWQDKNINDGKIK